MAKLILFDLAGTVAEMYWGPRRFLIVNGKRIEAKKLYRIYESKAYEDFAKGFASEEEVIASFLERSELDLSPDEIRTIFRKYQFFLPGMRKLLSSLKKSHPLACLTEEGREWVQYKADALHLHDYFPIIIESNQLHALKRSKEFYVKSLRILDVRPEDCLFIDDKEVNCRIAEGIGIRSIVFKSPEQLKRELKRAGI